MTIWALHGFLGLPSDFDELKARCLQLRPELKWQSVNYLHFRELSPQNPLSRWGAHFCDYVRKTSEAGEENILLGYSQGGRLALHALKEAPRLWSSTILLSANPGIPAGEASLRLQNDKKWASRFLNEEFARTVREWNAQAVFQGSKNEPQRNEIDFNRQQLADCSTNWSVGNQENFTDFLTSQTHAILYVAGEMDLKYCHIGESLSRLNRQIDFEKIPGSGHRVLFDQPQLLAEKMIQYLQKKIPKKNDPHA